MVENFKWNNISSEYLFLFSQSKQIEVYIIRKNCFVYFASLITSLIEWYYIIEINTIIRYALLLLNNIIDKQMHRIIFLYYKF